MSLFEIVPTPFDAPEARSLVEAALVELGQLYGGSGDETPINAAEFVAPAGCFLVASAPEGPVGCGGWRSLAADPDAAEIKRMYTVPEWRGRGVASTLLRALEETARASGRKRMVLETGDRQPEAIALYLKLGYERIENFGFYKDAAGCQSFGRTL